MWVSGSALPEAAKTAYGNALSGLLATDQLVAAQASDSDKALAMLVGLRDDLTALDAARITLK